MTPADRLKEIRERLEAYCHWKKVSGESIEDTHAPDVIYLLERIVSAEFNLKSFYRDISSIRMATDDIPEFRDINRMIREALSRSQALADSDNDRGKSCCKHGTPTEEKCELCE